MKLTFKIGLIILGIITVLFIATGIYIGNKSPVVYENHAPDIKIVGDSALLAEGARIASLLCVNCHGDEEGTLSGGYLADTKKFGELYAPNITRHPDAIPAFYTDGELLYLFRTGIKKNGHYAPPWMPKFPLMSDQDLQSIVAFLRSDHQMLKPSEIVQPTSRPSFLAKALTLIAFKPLPYPSAPIPNPDTTDKVAWGAYLATAKFDCFSCHSADFATLNLMEPAKSVGFFGGGNPLEREDGTPVLSPNLTMDKLTGIGNWTEEEFIKAVRFGERKSGIPTAFPMMPFSNMTNAEVAAIWAYLQTVPVLVKKPEK